MMRRPVLIKNLGISQFFQLPLNVCIARNIPIPALRLYLYFWGMIYVMFSFRIFSNIATCLSLINKMKLHAPLVPHLLKSLFGVFEHYFEKLVMAYKDLEEVRSYLDQKLVVSNKHLLDKLAAEGKGALLVTGHFGAVEYLPLSLAMQGYKVSMICKFKTKELKQALMKKAATVGVQLIDASEPGVAFKAVRAIKEGRFLITECDEFSQWRFHRSRRVSVFGMMLPQDRTLDFFFKKVKASTFLILMKREREKINMMVEFLANGKTEKTVAAKAWKALEKHIFQNPFQWYQIKGAAKFLMENAIEAEIEHKENKNIPNKNTVFTPSYS